MDTVYALSSGAPPAGIAVIRVSGPHAKAALNDLAGSLPAPRRASARRLRNRSGVTLDDALVLWLPGPGTATGEDIAELHLHGGRAVVAAVEEALSAFPGLRRAKPGEFTRRAFANGRLDLAEAEGLADLLAAETELQRRSALEMLDGKFSRQVNDWREAVLHVSAQIEAVLDFSDEDDVAVLPAEFTQRLNALSAELLEWLAKPRAERLKEGFKVVMAGPPNSGKSTLFNALLDDDAAIVSPIAGTTRDVLERSVSLAGIPFTFVDTAGLRSHSDDSIEVIGIERAHAEALAADLVLWLGDEGEGPSGAWEIDPKCDRDDRIAKHRPDLSLSAKTGEGVGLLRERLISRASNAMPQPGSIALNMRQHRLIESASDALSEIAVTEDPLLVAEQLRLARLAFDSLIGRTSTEDMLDALFGRFCIGK
ncbi:tRNA uridine-5-carboxymethylaminomethyl(34) synthesis GTPase MnmE [Pontixanthobacter sp.]|uniref:tRNA uridine-5-carboxymethylaminomethyl(34) synthesis GTPase MnmE n=1 Tax=Pontixanthobacter sp. TaxID=2792078 RepID=UPI003C7DCDA9